MMKLYIRMFRAATETFEYILNLFNPIDCRTNSIHFYSPEVLKSFASLSLSFFIVCHQCAMQFASVFSFTQKTSLPCKSITFNLNWTFCTALRRERIASLKFHNDRLVFHIRWHETNALECLHTEYFSVEKEKWISLMFLTSALLNWGKIGSLSLRNGALANND